MNLSAFARRFSYPVRDPSSVFRGVVGEGNLNGAYRDFRVDCHLTYPSAVVG